MSLPSSPDARLDDTVPAQPVDAAADSTGAGDAGHDSHGGDSGDAASGCGGKSGRPRAADVEARLQNLMATAAELFLEHGYSKVSLEAIARQAHVAVRTIYVKFGGKAGLLNALIDNNRARYFAPQANMQADTRPIKQVLSDFGFSFLQLVSACPSVKLHRIIIAEAMSNPELADTFNKAGPLKTREIVMKFFARPDIAAQFRADISHEALTTHLINCLMGDQLSRFLRPLDQEPLEADLRTKVKLGLDLFFRGTLRQD